MADVFETLSSGQRWYDEQFFANQMKVAQGGWQVSREGIAAQLKVAKMQIEQQREEMKKIGIPTMEANRWYQQQQVRLADQAHQTVKAQLGLDYLKWQSSLSGPENYAQASNFARGAANNPNVPVYLQELMKNNVSSGYQAPVGIPTPLTAEGIIGRLAGGNTSAEAQFQASRAAAASVFERGAGALAPGTLEALDESEIKMLGSLGGDLGVDVPRWMRDYQRTRLGTESPLLA